MWPGMKSQIRDKGDRGNSGNKGMQGAHGHAGNVPVSGKVQLSIASYPPPFSVQCVCSQGDLEQPQNNATAGAIRLVAKEKSLFVYTRQLGWVKVLNNGGTNSRRRRSTGDKQQRWNNGGINRNASTKESNREVVARDSVKRSNQQLL